MACVQHCSNKDARARQQDRCMYVTCMQHAKHVYNMSDHVVVPSVVLVIIVELIVNMYWRLHVLWHPQCDIAGRPKAT